MTSSTPPPQKSLSVLALRGTLWAYISFVSGKVLVFVSTVILARLLAPEQFGVMGYCLIALQYLDILSDFGMEAALIARRDKVAEAANAAFVFSIASSLLMFGAAWVGAPSLARFFKESSVTELLRTLAVVVPISGLAAVPNALLQRELRFKTKLIPDIGRSLMKGLFSIGLAWQGFGVWSLVLGQIAGEVTTTLTVWLLVRWRPTFKFDAQATREMLRIGGHLILIGIVGAVITNVDYLLVGSLLGAAALGFYTLAYRIPELIISNTNSVISKVALPLIARLQTEPQRLHAVFFTYLRYISLFTFPVGVGLALTASPLIHVFYTSKWEPAIVVMQFIAVAIAVGSTGYVPGVFYKAINRPEILNYFTLVKVPLTVGILWYGTRWGIAGVAAGQVVVTLVNLTLNTVLAYWVLKVSPYQMFLALRPALMGSAVMGLVVTGGMAWLQAQSAISLVLLIVMGAAAYGATLAVVSRDTVAQAGTALRAALARS